MRSENSPESGKTCLGPVGLGPSIMAAARGACTYTPNHGVLVPLAVVNRLSFGLRCAAAGPIRVPVCFSLPLPQEDGASLSLINDSILKDSTRTPTTPFTKIKSSSKWLTWKKFLSCNCREQKYGSGIIFFFKGRQRGDGEMAQSVCSVSMRSWFNTQNPR